MAEDKQNETNNSGAGAKQGGGQPKKTKRQVLRVSARTERFRRAGLEFTRAERVLDKANLTDEQIARLKDEPYLLVTEAEEDA